MTTLTETKTDFNFDLFESHPTPFLNTSIIGIGNWGCEMLKTVARTGLQHAFTLALPTSDDEMAGYRHPAARIIPLKNDKHFDSKLAFANNLLQETDVYIVIFSSENQLDADVAHRILNSIDSCSKSITITDTSSNIHTMSPGTGKLNATVLVNTAEGQQTEHLVSSYILTLVNIFYKHKFMAIEHTDLIKLISHKRVCSLSKNIEIALNEDNKYEIGKSLGDNLPSNISSVLICLEFGNKAVLSLGDFCDSIVIERESNSVHTVISFVPTSAENDSLALKIFCFE